jgi:enoyl-CoA hydratase
MADAVSYRVDGGVAVIAMDDGKVNALSVPILAALHDALDRAVEDDAVVVLTGRPGVFSAGFDLTTLRTGGSTTAELVVGGFRLVERLAGIGRPVVAACPGHAVAMGAFLLLGADVRVGAGGPFRIMANEVAIGLSLPQAAIQLCRARLAPTHLGRVLCLSEPLDPVGAVAAGFLDRVVPPDDLEATALAEAVRLAGLDPDAYRRAADAVSGPWRSRLRAAIEADALALGATARERSAEGTL